MDLLVIANDSKARLLQDRLGPTSQVLTLAFWPEGQPSLPICHNVDSDTLLDQIEHYRPSLILVASPGILGQGFVTELGRQGHTVLQSSPAPIDLEPIGLRAFGTPDLVRQIRILLGYSSKVCLLDQSQVIPIPLLIDGEEGLNSTPFRTFLNTHREMAHPWVHLIPTDEMVEIAGIVGAKDWHVTGATNSLVPGWETSVEHVFLKLQRQKYLGGVRILASIRNGRMQIASVAGGFFFPEIALIKDWGELLNKLRTGPLTSLREVG